MGIRVVWGSLLWLGPPFVRIEGLNTSLADYTFFL